MYMRALRTIINEAKANGIISQAQYPFAIKKNGGYAIPKEGRKIALNTSQLWKYSIIKYIQMMKSGRSVDIFFLLQWRKHKRYTKI